MIEPANLRIYCNLQHSMSGAVNIRFLPLKVACEIVAYLQETRLINPSPVTWVASSVLESTSHRFPW